MKYYIALNGMYTNQARTQKKKKMLIEATNCKIIEYSTIYIKFKNAFNIFL